MSSDNLDRAMDDLHRAIEATPPPAILLVLSKWESRIQEIRHQLDFVGKSGADPNCPAAREMRVLEQATKEVEAACAVEKGDPLRTFRIMLENDQGQASAGDNT